MDSDLVSIKEDLVGQGGEGEEQIMMLNNGCLCCTVRDDLVDMLGKLVRAEAETCEGGGYAVVYASGPPLSNLHDCSPVNRRCPAVGAARQV